MYLDIAENRAKRQIPMKMKDWVEELNTMLKTNRYEVLDNKGHSDPSITLRTYVTIFNNVKAKSTKKVSAYYDKLNLFRNKVTNNEEEQKIPENNQKSHSNIIYFPTEKIVGNDWYER